VKRVDERVPLVSGYLVTRRDNLCLLDAACTTKGDKLFQTCMMRGWNPLTRKGTLEVNVWTRGEDMNLTVLEISLD
jgi:hypothetical protein